MLVPAVVTFFRLQYELPSSAEAGKYDAPIHPAVVEQESIQFARLVAVLRDKSPPVRST